MPNEFPTGTVVKLRSGGPKMTVTGTKDGKVMCTWFEGSTLRDGLFPAEALEIYVASLPDVRRSRGGGSHWAG